MSEWWTYRLADLRLFSERTYLRLFERYNHEVWPLHVVAIAIGVLVVVLTLRSRPKAAGPLLAIAWLFVAYAFHWKRYATIQTAAKWFAVVFVVEAILILWRVVSGVRCQVSESGLRELLTPDTRYLRPRGIRRIGVGVAIFGLVIEPLITLTAGRVEVFGIAPDPTAVTTMGIALALGERLLLPIPVLWCMVSGATLWTLHTRDALLVPAVALFVLLVSLKETL